jgi:hypothetical protein
MAEIGRDHARGEVDIISCYSIDYDGSLCDDRMISEITSLDLRERSCSCMIPEVRIPSNMGKWSDFTIFSKIDISFDIRSRLEYDSCFEMDISFDDDIWLYGSSEIDSGCIPSYDFFMGFQKIPGISYRDPSSFRFDYRVASLMYIDVYEIGDFELTSG